VGTKEEIMKVVNEQAENEALWSIPVGSYRKMFFELGKGGVISYLTSLRLSIIFYLWMYTTPSL
jgi:hypothetical protein